METTLAQVSVMSFNIRYDTNADGHNAWSLRKEEVAAFIKRSDPDFLGIQEGLYHQVNYLQEKLSAYEFIGKGRDDGDKKGEFSCIFYKKKFWKPAEQHTLWLSPTPEKVSKGWDAALERIFTYGAFVHRMKGDTIFVINTHFDHMGKEARHQSAKLILDFLLQKKLTEKRIIVMGDLNCDPVDLPIRALKSELTDSYDAVKHHGSNLTATFNGFDTLSPPAARIDYVLFRNLIPKAFSIMGERRINNLWLSDHCPVWAEFDF